MQTFNTSRLKTSLLCLAGVFPIGFCLGLFVSFWDAHWKVSALMMSWPYYMLMTCILVLLIFLPPFVLILFGGWCNSVQVLPTGLTIIARTRGKSGNRDTFFEIPWSAIREVRMRPAFPRYLKMTEIQLLCADEGIEVNSFLPPLLGKRVALSFGKNPPKKFAYAARAFPSGLLIFSLPWQLQCPEDFKVALMQEAPPDHPLAKFFHEHHDLVQ